jgi:hypothetical protein
MRRAIVLGLCLLPVIPIGCASYPGAPSLGLQRSLSPGLGDLDQSGIEAALAKKVEVTPPVSAGLVWLSEASAGSPEAVSYTPITEYARTGVLEEAMAALRQEPFGTVATLPTIPRVTDAPPSDRTIDALRSASARFQYDVALLLQTGTAEDTGLNPFALGYAGLVTILLFPGQDIAASSSAELCAIDVRTSVMLGCARGRAEQMDRFLFPWQQDRARERLVERTLRASVSTAAKDLLSQLSGRFAAR